MTADFAAVLHQTLRDDVQLSTDGRRLDYDGPNDAVTPQLLVDLKRVKPELVSWLRHSDPHGLVEARSLPSYIQQELWHKDKASGGPVVYTVSQRWYLDGEFDPAAWEAAMSWWVERHEALRARFSVFRDADGEQPVYEVVTPWQPKLPVTDLTDLPEGERQDALDEYCGRIVQQPFSLDNAPLWRMRLYRLGPDRHALLWMLHHIISDGTAMGILREELIDAYDALRSHRQPRRDPVPVTSTQFARWQRRELSEARLGELTEFWRAELSGAPLQLDFPYDFPRPATLSGDGEIVEWNVSAQTLGQLRETARRLNTTMYVVMLSTYAVMLSEFTGQREVVLPISHANRIEAGHEHAVGMLMDRVPIRIKVAAAASFADLSDQVGRAIFDAMDHQAIPLSLILAALPREQRPTGGFPAALFTLLDGFDTCRQPADLAIDVRPDGPVGKARMEFYCFMTADANGLHGWLEFSSDLFTAPTVRRWMDRFIELLEVTAVESRTEEPKPDIR